MKKILISTLLLLSLLSTAAQGQPTARLTVSTNSIDWFGAVHLPEVGTAIYIQDRFGNRVSRGETDQNGEYTFELPYGTYTIVVLYDENIELLFGNECPLVRVTLATAFDSAHVTCRFRTYLRFPWMNPG